MWEVGSLQSCRDLRGDGWSLDHDVAHELAANWTLDRHLLKSCYWGVLQRIEKECSGEIDPSGGSGRKGKKGHPAGMKDGTLYGGGPFRSGD